MTGDAENAEEVEVLHMWKHKVCSCLPVHAPSCPLPRYPDLHVQLNSPNRSVQTARSSHVCIPEVHASMSDRN